MNNGQRITFNLTAAQVPTPLTLRVGISLAFAGDRPRVRVNAGQTYAWTSSIPTPGAQPDSRGITRGTWCGNNTTFAYDLPTNSLRAGVNTIDLPVVSGSSGATYLSPNVTFEALDLVTTASPTGAAATFGALAYDHYNNPIPVHFAFAAAGGVIDDNGHYVAPVTTGSDTIPPLRERRGSAAYTSQFLDNTSIEKRSH